MKDKLEQILGPVVRHGEYEETLEKVLKLFQSEIKKVIGKKELQHEEAFESVRIAIRNSLRREQRTRLKEITK